MISWWIIKNGLTAKTLQYNIFKIQKSNNTTSKKLSILKNLFHLYLNI